MSYTTDQLIEAKRRIVSTLHKLRETLKTLEGKENPSRYKSRITLARRRIEAFKIAVEPLVRRCGVGQPAPLFADSVEFAFSAHFDAEIS